MWHFHSSAEKGRGLDPRTPVPASLSSTNESKGARCISLSEVILCDHRDV